MTRNNGVARLIVFIVIGLILGGVLGESLGMLLGRIGAIIPGMGEDNMVRDLFVKSFEPQVGIEDGTGVLIDLYLVKFRIGLGFKFNLVSIVGMFVSLYVMKWSGERG
jgi:hypothetical protein